MAFCLALKPHNWTSQKSISTLICVWNCSHITLTQSFLTFVLPTPLSAGTERWQQKDERPEENDADETWFPKHVQISLASWKYGSQEQKISCKKQQEEPMLNSEYSPLPDAYCPLSKCSLPYCRCKYFESRREKSSNRKMRHQKRMMRSKLDIENTYRYHFLTPDDNMEVRNRRIQCSVAKNQP